MHDSFLQKLCKAMGEDTNSLTFSHGELLGLLHMTRYTAQAYAPVSTFMLCSFEELQQPTVQSHSLPAAILAAAAVHYRMTTFRHSHSLLSSLSPS